MAELISSFAASFFLLSWATGQFFRIQKQKGVEDRFEGIKSDIEHLLESLKIQTDRVFNELTGGESYPACMFLRCDDDPSHLQMWVENKGDHPLYDIHVRVADLDEMERISNSGTHNLSDFAPANKSVAVARLDGHHGGAVELVLDLTGRDRPMFNIFMRARNGQFFQQVTFFRHTGAWLHDERIELHDGTVLESRSMSEEIKGTETTEQ